ncbi:MAG TPA: glycosyltransferase family 39 protein [Vicinamibacterales bacterium]|nr:glycosyltransferase family 39 protein [Vicinamibacterales bacterium]
MTLDKRRTRFALGGIALGALALRVWGLDFGLPLWSNYYIRPDESLIVEAALRVGQDPRFYVYPALMSWVSGVGFAAYHAVAALADPSVPGSLAAHAARSVDGYFMLARLVSAVAGAAVVFPVFTLAAGLGSASAGLMASALVAAAPLAVRDAHFGVTDTLMTTLAACALARTAALSDAARRTRALLVVGLLAGLTVGTKYTGVFFLPAIAAGVWVSATGRAWRDLALAGLAAAGVFVVINPYAVLHLGDLLAIARMLTDDVFHRQGASGVWTPLVGLANMWRPLRHGPGLDAGSLLALLGMAAVVWRRTAMVPTVVTVMAVAGMALPLFLGQVVVSRYVLPLVPLVAVFAAVALSAPPARGLRRAAMLAGVALVAASAAEAAWLDRILSRDDTRTLAGRWMAATLPPGCTITYWGPPETEPQLRETVSSIDRRIAFAMQTYGPESGEIVSRLYRLARSGVAASGPRFEVFRNRPPDAGREPSCAAVVTAGYPGWSAPEVASAELVAPAAGAPTEWASFDPFTGHWSSAPVESFDAFFVPLDFLNRVERPGPVIDVVVYRIGSAP